MSNRSREKTSKMESETPDAELVANYRQRAARRRAESILRNSAGMVRDCVVSNDGVVTVTLPTAVKPISTMGGVSKVLGHAKISIPEFKP